MKYLFFLLVLVNIAFYLWETGPGRAAKPEDRAQPPAEAGERLVLLKELPQTPAPPPAEAPPPPPAEAPPPPEQPPAQTCRRLGPYDSAAKARAALRQAGLAADAAGVVKKPAEVERGYLVIYPAAESEEAALANRKMLVEKGFKDLWILKDGENRNAISLAVVGDKARAEAALARYQAQGIQAEMKPRMALADKWWLEVHDEAARAALAAANPPPAGKACD